MNSSKPQVIIIGSGINSLVCAALLSIWGKSVLVLERNAVLGGCIRTEELFPGYIHDVLSCWYPLFLSSPAYQMLKPELEKAGVEFIQSDYSTGLVQPNGRGIALKRGILPAALQLDKIAGKDGEAFRYMVQQILHDDAELVFSLLGQNPYGFSVLRLLFREWRKRGIDGLVEFAGNSLETFRRWSERELQSDFIRSLIAPWALHTGLGPDDASSALIGKLTFAAVVSGGMPVVKGGSSCIVEALKMIIEQHGGQLLTHTKVEHIITHQRGRKCRASGVIAEERVYHATDAVVCNVTPQQLYGHLLDNVPDTVQQHAKGYRYGRGGMQVHFALNSPPSWSDPKLCHVPLIHLTESMQEICLSVTQANNGYLPEHPTLAIGQPVALDPGRAPEGGWILWVQMQELPTYLKGDASGEIPIPDDGKWNDAVREAFADRVQTRLERVIPGFSSTIVGRRAYSPADLQTLNCNLVEGDPYSGICSPDQFFWLRPFASSKRTKAHQTFIRNVFHIGSINTSRTRISRDLWLSGCSQACATLIKFIFYIRYLLTSHTGGSVMVKIYTAIKAKLIKTGIIRYRRSIQLTVLSLFSISVMSALVVSHSVMATEGGGVGIYPDGLDNYLSGALPPSGVHVLLYGGNIHYNQLRGNNGSRLHVPGFKVNVNVLAPRLVLVTDQQIMGEQLAYHTIVPLLSVTAEAAGKRSDSKGIGDITFGPALGYHPAPDLGYVIGLDINAPTGNYNRHDPSSLGKNHWAFQPVWAISYFPAYGYNTDLKVMYDVNLKNKKTKTTSGRAFHIDYALGWGFGNGLVAGVGGYAFQQVTDDSGPNSAQGKASAFGLGPSVRYANDKGLLVALKWQKDLVVTNRPAGSQLFLKVALPF